MPWPVEQMTKFWQPRTTVTLWLLGTMFVWNGLGTSVLAQKCDLCDFMGRAILSVAISEFYERTAVVVN